MRTPYRLTLLPLLLTLPTMCFADISKDVQKCHQSQNGPDRAACFQKLIPHLDDLSKQGVGNTSWAESLKEAYGATAQFAKLSEAERRIETDGGADKLLSTVLGQTNNKTQAYMAVAQYFQALGPNWQEAAKRAETLGKIKEHENAELPPSIKTQIADAIHAVQPGAPSASASSSSTVPPGYRRLQPLPEIRRTLRPRRRVRPTSSNSHTSKHLLPISQRQHLHQKRTRPVLDL